MPKIYRFIGEGRGVPGLPHELTEADILRLGCERTLADALKRKIYEVVEDKTGIEKPPVKSVSEKQPEQPEKKRKSRSVPADNPVRGKEA